MAGEIPHYLVVGVGKIKDPLSIRRGLRQGLPALKVRFGFPARRSDSIDRSSQRRQAS